MPNGVVLTGVEMAVIRTMIERLGEVHAAKALEIERLTTLRAMAGLIIRRRTADHIRRKLAEPRPAVGGPVQLSLPLATTAPAHMAA